jgi:hypothetical protein
MTTQHQHDHAHTRRPPVTLTYSTSDVDPLITHKGTVDEDAIRARAYQLWESAGRPDGDSVTYWVEAERELTGR